MIVTAVGLCGRAFLASRREAFCELNQLPAMYMPLYTLGSGLVRCASDLPDVRVS